MDNEATPRDAADFGKWLADLREARGISQQKLAAAAEVSTRTVQRWEAGSEKPLEVVRVLDALGVSIDPPVPETAQSVRAQLAHIRRVLATRETVGVSDVLDVAELEFWEDVHRLGDDEAAAKWNLASGTDAAERRREIGRKIASDPAIRRQTLERFQVLQLQRELGLQRDSPDRQSIPDRLEALEGAVAGLARDTTEALARLAAAIDELSARIPGEAPGTPQRRTARRR